MNMIYTLEMDFNTMLGDTINEKMVFLKERLKGLQNWLCESLQTDQKQCFVVGQMETVSILSATEWSEPIGDDEDCRQTGPGIELCKSLGYEPKWIIPSAYATDLFCVAYADDVPQGEFILIAKGYVTGSAILKIKNWIV